LTGSSNICYPFFSLQPYYSGQSLQLLAKDSELLFCKNQLLMVEYDDSPNRQLYLPSANSFVEQAAGADA